MGLGEIARDSIVGLDKIVQEDDDHGQPPRVTRRLSNNGILSRTWTSGTTENEGMHEKNKSNEGMSVGDQYHDDNDSCSAVSLSRVPSFHVPLTDGLTSMGEAVATVPSLSPSSHLVSAPPSGIGVFGGNSSTSSSAVQNLSRYQGFQYEGYADYYSDDFASYSFDEYSHSNSTDGSNASQHEPKNIFCCLFAPWMQHKAIKSVDVEDNDLPAVILSDRGEESAEDSHEHTAASLDMVLDSPTLTPTPSIDEKISATAASSFLDLECESARSNDPLELPNLHSNARTPKASQNFDDAKLDGREPTESCSLPMDIGSSSEPKSVEAITLLIQEEVQSKNEEKKQEEGDHEMRTTSSPDAFTVDEGQINNAPAPRPIKGILKAWSSTNSLPKGKDTGHKSVTTPLSPNKRHLFPTYEQKKPNSTGRNAEAKAIQFNPMARVLTIPSRNDIPLQQKAQVWWQKYDYDEFKKTGRIISKAMECGGSEIWLASSNAWGDKSARSGPRERATISNCKHTEEYHKALSKYVNEPNKDNDDSDDSSNFGNKWWCKFGHSRRGLEHVVSSSEGKARQQSVLLAIRMVMEEQKRQRANRSKDPNKLRSVAMQYTSWAKDLALAAGAADAEAVASNFDPSAACRAQHFAKRLNVNSSTLHTLNNSDIVGKGVAMAVTSQLLDANTHRAPIATKKKSTTRLVEQSSQPSTIADHSRTKDISLSKRAKGFMPGGMEDISAAAVLSGMGNMGFRSVKA